DVLLRLPTPLVLDHVGRIPQPADLGSPTYQLVRRLVDNGHTWVKLSGPYQDSKVGPPTWSDVAVLAKALVQAAPERMVWASDWPHPTVPTNKPDDAQLLDLLLGWAPEAATRERILVENPQILYGFPKVG